METHLADWIRQAPEGAEIESILRACVHCGFCTATCPTYQLLGDERDGPRGRIYLLKQMFEGQTVGTSTRQHLDRCLSCRSCETTCPSGVRYHRLLDLGRAMLDARQPRSGREQLQRRLLRAVLTRPRLFGLALGAARLARPLLPAPLAGKVHPSAPAGVRPAPRHPRRMLILEGCVQPSLSPNTNAATARVLNALGISLIPAPEAGCCGAVDYHLDAHAAGLDRARHNIDAWWPAITAGAEAIIQTASGCGAFVKEYATLLKDDPAYAPKAARVSALAKDLVEVLGAESLEERLAPRLKPDASPLAFHCPCTLQHAQKLGGAVEAVLRRLGYTLAPVADGHLCCGSAGTYSLLQPEISHALRARKLDALERHRPSLILTANIGCQTHLASAGRTPVRHWIEVVDANLGGKSPGA